jgi:hypothetical protein
VRGEVNDLTVGHKTIWTSHQSVAGLHTGIPVVPLIPLPPHSLSSLILFSFLGLKGQKEQAIVAAAVLNQEGTEDRPSLGKQVTDSLTNSPYESLPGSSL